MNFYVESLPEEKPERPINYDERVGQSSLESVVVSSISSSSPPCDFPYPLSENLEDSETEEAKTQVSLTREERIMQLLRLDGLNSEEVNNVKNLVRGYTDRFCIPGELLNKTHLVSHKIRTTDDAPINVNQRKAIQVSTRPQYRNQQSSR